MSQHIAFVTGAMGGLGTAFCQAFDKAGYKVVATITPNLMTKKPGWPSKRQKLPTLFRWLAMSVTMSRVWPLLLKLKSWQVA